MRDAILLHARVALWSCKETCFSHWVCRGLKSPSGCLPWEKEVFNVETTVKELWTSLEITALNDFWRRFSLNIRKFKCRTTRALLENVGKTCCCSVLTGVCQGFVFILLWLWKDWRGNVSQLRFPQWLLNRIMWGCTLWRHFKVIFWQCASQ